MGTIILAAIVVAVFWRPAYHLFAMVRGKHRNHHKGKIKEWASSLKTVVWPPKNLSNPPKV